MQHPVAQVLIKISVTGTNNTPSPLSVLITPCNHRHARVYFSSGFKVGHGFSLIEMLVVIVIGGILFTYATLAIRGHNPQERLQTEAKRFEQLIQMAQQEAILRGEDYGLEVTINSYRFLHLKNQLWVEISNDRLLRRRKLPQKMELELSLEDTTIVINPTRRKNSNFSLQGNSDESSSNNVGTQGKTQNGGRNKIQPQVYLLSSGEVTPEFGLRFFYPEVQTSYIVKGKFDGSIKQTVSNL